MQVEIDFYLCMEPDKVVYPRFNHNGFRGITTRNLSDVQKLKLITSKEYYEIESMIDSGSAVINGINEYTIYSGKGAYADSKTLYKIPKEVFEDFHKLVNGEMKPSIYAYIYKYTFKLDKGDYYDDVTGELYIRDVIKYISTKQNKPLPKYLQESNKSSKDDANGFMSAINAMTGD